MSGTSLQTKGAILFSVVCISVTMTVLTIIGFCAMLVINLLKN